MKAKIKAMILAAMISASAFAALPVTASAAWVKTDEGYSYTCGSDGSVLKGWQTIKGRTYYFGRNGIRRTGLRRIGDSVYYFGKNGVMRTGVVKIKGKTFDFGTDGKLINKKKPVELFVNENSIDTPAYYNGEVLMIPLREAAEALGYICEYDEKSGTVTVDDDYIQKAELTVGSSEVKFIGHLTVIDLSREVTLTGDTAVKNGIVYAPSDIFKEFLNDVSVSGNTVNISPSMAELD